MGKGYGGDFYTNKRSSDSLVYDYKNEIIPHFAIGWEEKYLNLSGVDRIIHMIDRIIINHREAFKSLTVNQKQQILFVAFKDLTIKTSETIPKITNFLNTSVSEYTDKILLEERCPRYYNSDEQKNKLEAIKKNATDSSFQLLIKMDKDFNTNQLVI